ncbi:MAG TPA: lytic transglycosylase domain-containing protein, partial [Gammaproteobacteria bacterium]|nr:lytic transglycosylase domain-containing protein [Gammaproteobacteria bacterium]
MPHNLLARLLYQESRYREDIISGRTVSSAGAVGIAQLIPRFFPDIDARDPRQAIPAAARYLARLCRQFGSWALAL